MQGQKDVKSLPMRRRGNRALRRLCAVGAAISVLLFPARGFADVRIESSTSDDTAAPLVQLVREQLATASPRTAALDARVTIGAAAFREALDNDNGKPIVATYLSSTEFETTLGSRQRPPHVTAIFDNPDPLTQLALAKALLSNARIGVFDSRAAHSLASRLKDRGVNTIPVAPGESIDALLRETDPFDAIIVLPDPTVLNRANINHAVRTLYQLRKVLIGYSSTLTRVGSLASVYPTPQGIARAARDALEEYATRGVLPTPTFVHDLDMTVNEQLARSLNIVLPDRATILEAIRSGTPHQEGAP